MTKAEMMANIAAGTGTAEIMANIYDDVEALTARVAALETQLASMQVVTLTEGADLHTLGIGEYLIPNATVSATILNKPVTNTHTAFIKVIAGGADGQKTMYYIPCSKTHSTFYQCAYYMSAWGAWNEVKLFDSGWIDLPLATGITAYSEAQKPRYRKIGKTVFLTGVYKGATMQNEVIATLPSGYRPQKKCILATASVGTMFGKISIETNGEIILNRTTFEPIIAENWHSIACTFEVD